MRGEWRPSIGAWPVEQSVRFRVWAPEHRIVEVEMAPAARTGVRRALSSEPAGWFSATLREAKPGDRYRYWLDGAGPFPDPASRCQPDGVHGWSEVVGPSDFSWSDAGWQPPELADAVLYELHVGTFSPEGTFDGVRRRLDHLARLGVTVLELMPVADFPGRWNWGYDGVCLFAPARCYGRPDDLRALINEAHGRGLAVVLDVVYNHLGPDGNYLGAFSRGYFTERHHTPWGAAVNLDGPGAEHVRALFVENALHWIYEYHLDGLRLDATHALLDDSQRHFLAELCDRVRAQSSGRRLLLIAEDHRNLAHMVQPERQGGWGLDAVWSDDLHHQTRVLLSGERDGYFRDFSGSAGDLARTVRQGWYFTGQHSDVFGGPHGSDPSGVPYERLITFLQNHDQIGNRAMGGRLHHEVDPAGVRAATALWLLAPETPLLFMGQEWAASSPFQYFTDHHKALGVLVTEGRRREFAQFDAFADAAKRATIPDPQSSETFQRSRLRWDERGRPEHQGMEALTQALLALRRSEPALRGASRERIRVEAAGEDGIWMLRWSAGHEALLVVARLRGRGTIRVPDALAPGAETLVTTEAPWLGSQAVSIRVATGSAAVACEFDRPGAVVLRGRLKGRGP